MGKQLTLDQHLHDYIYAQSYRPHSVLEKIAAYNKTISGGTMQVDPLQAQFMQILLRLSGVKRVLELGTFTGYSTLAMALALPEDGQIVTCDIDEKIVEVAKGFWSKSLVSHKIKSVISDGLTFMKDEPDALYDAVFIDAVKNQYASYFEEAMRLVPKGGVIMIDNVLWAGRVVEENPSDQRTVSIQAFNTYLHGDERIDLSLLPIGDGLTIARKR